MTYLRYWKMSFSPFQRSASSSWFFASNAVDEALARVQFLATHGRRFGLLVGGTGVGRTALVRYLPRYLASTETSIPIDIITLTCPTIDSLPRKLAASLSGYLLGGVRGGQNVKSRAMLEDSLVALKSQLNHLLVLIDDLHLSDHRFQTELGWLLRIEAPITFLATVHDSELRAIDSYLLDRCELRIDLAPWNLEETADFFEQAIEVSGAAEDLFDAQAIVRVQELSRGIPRRICQIAELSLVAGAVRKTAKISSNIVDEAVQELPVGISAAFRSTEDFAA